MPAKGSDVSAALATMNAVVIGAGLIGLSCAWRARRSGLSVLVVDRAAEPGAAASRVAAGMLAPVTEADFGDEDKLGVNLRARGRWPAFAAELEEVTGLPTGYRDSGALVVAAGTATTPRSSAACTPSSARSDSRAEWLTPPRCRALEPGVVPTYKWRHPAHGDGIADPVATVRARRSG